MSNNWWKYLACLLIIYTVIAGLLFPVPHLPILHETIRNLYFHVPMWFCMIVLFSASVVNAIQYLTTENELYDVRSVEYINTGIVFGICGLITGSLWAKYTWGQWWVIADPKLNGAAIVMLEYFAYLVLRGSIQDEKQKAKVSGVYNIFACASIIPLLFILPRMADSLHPGNGGNPGFNKYDLDNHMRMIFYPAVAGWIMIGVWLATLRIRLRKIENKIHEDNQ